MTPKKNAPKPAKLTDQERHARFIEAAKRAEASDDPADFERAFKAVTKKPPPKPTKAKTPNSDD